MAILLAGEPVRFVIPVGGLSTTASTVSINLYFPGTSTARTLSANEIFTFVSVSAAATNAPGGTVTFTTLAGGTAAGSVAAANTLLVLSMSGDGEAVWHDDQTYSLSGLPGVTPSVLISAIAASTTAVTGAGIVQESGMSPGVQNPQWATGPLSNN